MVVQNPFGDGLHSEALEHAETDLRVPLEHDPLGLGQGAGLAQKLFWDRELAEIVQARREARELDLLVGETEPARRPRGQLRHALRVAAAVGVAGVDRAREARGGPEPSGPVGTARQALQLGELDHVRPVGAYPVLAVLLRPVERAVGEPDQLVALGCVLR